ncbi:MAG: hypothetical protein LRY54_03610 [Alphaproteobacteria bacterium]|nr:hypothetical protein [Alphaproteobacteria bacterium]
MDYILCHRPLTMKTAHFTRRVLLPLAVVITAAAGSLAHADMSENLKTVPPYAHEAVRASVVNTEPTSYTIDVKTVANIGVNEDAPTFAIYITRRLPDTCGDFRKLELPYTRPGKYKRQFDLSHHKDVIRALNTYSCVVIRNIPSRREDG